MSNRRQSELAWSAEDQYIIFSVAAGVPPNEWGRFELNLTGADRRARIAPLISLLSRDAAVVDSDGQLRVTHTDVASWTAADLEGLGLPPAIPFSFGVSAIDGLLIDPKCEIRWAFYRPNSQAVHITGRTGCLVHIGTTTFTVLHPFYRVIEALNQPPGMESPSDRLAAIGELQAILPEGTRLDGGLRDIRIARANSFSLAPKIGNDGKPDFEIVPILSRSTVDDLGEDGVTARCPALTEDARVTWNRHVAKLATVRAVSSAGSGEYVVLDEPVRKALDYAQRLRKASASERLAFIRSPVTTLRTALEGELDDQTIEGLFWESDEFSERVRTVGLWQPKVLPFYSPAREPWLPPERTGIRVDDQLVPLEATEARELADRVRAAIEAGQSAVTHEGVQIPCNEESVRALEEAARRSKEPWDSTGVEHDDTHEREASRPVALLIHDNLEELDFEARRERRTGVVGEIPGLVAARLYLHQQHGVEWLQRLWSACSSGGVLADDMGLGKTIQALAFAAWLQDVTSSESGNWKPILIVAPTGLLKNWIAEHETHLASPGLGRRIEAFGTGLRELRHAGSPGTEHQDGIPRLDCDRLRDAEWVLATYETVRDYQHSFGTVPWSLVILDEVQKIKNPAAKMTDATKALNADFFLALTGTPVENRMADLWSIVDTVRPGALGSLREFIRSYEGDGPEAHEARQELRRRLVETMTPPILLRRIKEDHLDGLPPREVVALRRSMPQRQASEYQQVINRSRETGTAQGKMLEALHRLRSVSLHPYGRTDQSDDEYIRDSARLQVCFEVLEEIAVYSEKVLVFLESLELQPVLAELIQRRFQLAHVPSIINGSTPGAKRKRIADEFQEGKDFGALLLSPKAGGVGLTVTGANHVIHLSRWWNPAVEDQCSDRVYRIGQRKPVKIYLPMAIHDQYPEHSFDERLHSLLENKRSLSRSILAPPAGSEQDLRSLYEGVLSGGGV